MERLPRRQFNIEPLRKRDSPNSAVKRDDSSIGTATVRALPLEIGFLLVKYIRRNIRRDYIIFASNPFPLIWPEFLIDALDIAFTYVGNSYIIILYWVSINSP